MEIYTKIKLQKNEKTPIKGSSWKDKKQQHKHIDSKLYNIGIPTGSVNNLFVLDIDVKDDGLEEWQTYINTYNEPNTMKIKTPSGGFHYYFKYKCDDDKIDALTSISKTNKLLMLPVGIPILNSLLSIYLC